MKEVYVSIDIEADGPIPGINSMLSLGAAAFQLGDRTPVATFEANMFPLPEAIADIDTMDWWQRQPEAWAYVNQNQRQPAQAMQQFRAWLGALPGKPVFVGFPATYDFMFAYWYLVRFTGFPVPFGFQGLDIKTAAMMKLKLPFRETAKRVMPKRWFEGMNKHTHKALDDAIGQGILFINLMAD
jgi:hypothetical protein